MKKTQKNQRVNPQKKILNRVFSKINTFLLLLLIFFLPTQLGKHFFLPFSYLSGVRIDYLAPTVYVTDIIVFILMIINIKVILSFFSKKSIILIFGLLFINTLLAQSVFISIYRLIKTVEIFIVFAVINKCCHDKPFGKLWLPTFFAGGIFEFVLAVSQLITKHSIGGIFYFFGERYLNLSMPGIAKASLQGIEMLRPYATFSHPNSMAGFYLLLYFFILTNKKINIPTLLKYLMLFVFSFLVFLSFSKLAILILLLLTTYYYLLTTKQNCHLCTMAKLITIIIVAILFLQAKTDPLSLQKRIDLNFDALHIIAQYPIIGVGIGNYLIAQNQFPIKYPYFFLQPVHNILLLFLAETGIVFGSLILWNAVNLIKQSLKNITFLFVIAVILLTGMFDHYPLTLQQNMLLSAVILGFLL